MLKKINAVFRPNHSQKKQDSQVHGGNDKNKACAVRLVRSTSMLIVGETRQKNIVSSLKRSRSSVSIESTAVYFYRQEDRIWLYSRTQDCLQYLEDLMALRRQYVNSVSNLKTAGKKADLATDSANTSKPKGKLPPPPPPDQHEKPRVKDNRLERATRVSSAPSVAGPSVALGAPEPLLHELSQDPLLDIPGAQASRSHSPSPQVRRVKRSKQARDIMDLKAVKASLVGGLARDPACPNPQCRVTETHLKWVYKAKAQVIRLTNTTGIIEAVAKDFFNSEVNMTILNQSEEEECTGQKEHVVFLVTQKKNVQKRKAKERGGKGMDKLRDKEVSQNFSCLVI
ncbi:UNVERIFIED_CONTAM: hypothetical protein FKN15_001396 [Acipenser sinensis]